jgi:hypothetical protein
MATKSKPTSRRSDDIEEVDLTIFGRRWTPAEWTTPLILWGAFVLLAVIVNRLQHIGSIPAGGSGFVLGMLGLTALFTFCGVMLGGRASMRMGTTLWCALTPAAGGLWALYVSLVGMTTGGLTPWIVLSILALLTSVWFRTMRDAQRDHELMLIYDYAEEAENEAIAAATEHLAQQQTQPVDADKAKWEAWTDAAGLVGMIFHGRYPTRNKSGFMLHYELPDDGSISFDAVTQAATRLELQLFKKHRNLFHLGRVRPGCVRVVPATDEDGGELVGELFIAIDVVDILRKTLQMPTRPEDYTELSITKAFQVGEFVDGSPIYLTIHEIHVLIIGQTQNGKSNLLHVMIRQLARCTDAVIWALDFKGGDTVRLWMNPWMQGMIDPHTGKPLAKCIFDWVGIDPIEAERMLLSALEAAKRRPNIAGGGGWIPSKDRPAIIVLADEVSEMVASKMSGQGGRGPFHVAAEILSEHLTSMFKLGTGQGVYGITASQRGTVGEVGSGTAKSQQKGRIILPVSEGVSDVLQGSGPEARRQASKLKHKGSVVIEGWEHAEGKPGKIWLMGIKAEIKDKVTHEVLQLTHLRHGVRLDAETAQFLLKYGYEGRPGGPSMDPDRIAWYYGRDPKRQLVTWDHHYGPDGKVVKTGGDGASSGAFSALSGGGGGSLASTLGLEQVDSPFGDVPKPAAPAAPAAASGQPAPVVSPSRDAAARASEWHTRNRQLLEEIGMGGPAQPLPGMNVAAAAGTPQPEPEQEPAGPAPLFPAGVAPTYENSMLLMIHLIHESGATGIAGADLLRKMEDAGHAPSRTGLYPWLGRLVKDTGTFTDVTKKVIKEGSVYMTEANKPMPSKLA